MLAHVPRPGPSAQHAHGAGVPQRGLRGHQAPNANSGVAVSFRGLSPLRVRAQSPLPAQAGAGAVASHGVAGQARLSAPSARPDPQPDLAPAPVTSYPFGHILGPFRQTQSPVPPSNCGVRTRPHDTAAEPAAPTATLSKVASDRFRFDATSLQGRGVQSPVPQHRLASRAYPTEIDAPQPQAPFLGVQGQHERHVYGGGERKVNETIERLKADVEKLRDQVTELQFSSQRDLQVLRNEHGAQQAELQTRVGRLEELFAQRLGSEQGHQNTRALEVVMSTLRERMQLVESRAQESASMQAVKLVQDNVAAVQQALMERDVDCQALSDRLTRCEELHVTTPATLEENVSGIQEMHARLGAVEGQLRDVVEQCTGFAGAEVSVTNAVEQCTAAHRDCVEICAKAIETQAALADRLDSVDCLIGYSKERHVKWDEACDKVAKLEEGLARSADGAGTSEAAEGNRDEKLFEAVVGRINYLEGLFGDAVGHHSSLDDRFVATESTQSQVQDKLAAVDGHLASIQRQLAKSRLDALKLQSGAKALPPRLQRPIPAVPDDDRLPGEQAQQQLSEVLGFIGHMDPRESEW